MPPTDLLRSSRDGDQFHYHWGARQALRLLNPNTELMAIAVEGVAPGETDKAAGEHVVDLAEYWGGLTLEDADTVVYRQLKHSTTDPDGERTSSYLSNTLQGFAAKFRSILDRTPEAVDAVVFEFLCVPPIAESVKDALAELSGDSSATTQPIKYLREQLETSLIGAEVGQFCRRFVIADREPGLLQLRQTLANDVASFLPGSAADQDVLLREMVSSRASSIAGADPVITRATVLTTLRVTEERLLPAPNLISSPPALIETPDAREVVRLVHGGTGPVLAHASGGVGKSVLASTVGALLPVGSLSLVFDCFGNGGYRRLSSRRHEHRLALLQLSNELAAHGLCDPLLPSDSAQPNDYMMAFLKRLKTASVQLRAANPDALLLLVIDAADNSVMAAEEAGTASFAPDLLRESLPTGVRLLMLGRTERRDKLRPDATRVDYPLAGFALQHSREHLESRFGQVSDSDASEFHRLTDHNPRVQDVVMTGATSVAGVLRALGATRTASHGDTIFNDLMRQNVAAIRDANGVDAAEVDRLGSALAALRPRIPVTVLAEIAGVQPDFVRSFASDMGRSLLVEHDTVQFRDEPTETWFRDEFRLEGESLAALIEAVRPLASKYTYLSSSLPQLLFEAGMVGELVDLALSDEALAAANDVERREIAHERAQFALKATLREGRDADAARLAWRAGELHAGESRRLNLIRANTDLAGEFLDAQTVDALLAKRALAGAWPGSHLHVEGALLASGATGGELARSRVRSAYEWMVQWVRTSVSRGEDHQVTDADIADLALGLLQVEGPEACVDFVGRWQPKRIAYDVGLRIARRLVDRNRSSDLVALAVAAKEIARLQMACVAVATEACIELPPEAVRRTIKLVRKHKTPIGVRPDSLRRLDPSPVAWILIAGRRHNLITPPAAISVMSRYLQSSQLPYGAGGRFGGDGEVEGQLFAMTLQARLRGTAIDTEAIAPPDVVKERKTPHGRTGSTVDYDANIVPLAQWFTLLVDIELAGVRTDEDLARLRTLASTLYKPWGDYQTPYMLINTSAVIAARVLTRDQVPPEDHDNFRTFLTNNTRHLRDRAINTVVRRLATVPQFHELALAFAETRRTHLSKADLPAQERADAYVDLARAIYVFDPHEARADFDAAVDITSQLGEDADDRWNALVAIATSAADGTDKALEAYRLAQVAEGLQNYHGADSFAARALPHMLRFSFTTSLAIASRWRDRRVADIGYSVEFITNPENWPTDADPRWAIGLLPLGADRYEPHLDSIGAPTSSQRIRADEVVDEWFRPVREPALPVEEPTQVNSPVRDNDGSKTDSAWLDDLVLTTPSGWVEALANTHGRKAWTRRTQLVKHAAEQPAQLLRPTVEAFAATSTTTLANHGDLLTAMVARTPLPQGARAAATSLVHQMAHRFAKDITTAAYVPVDMDTVQVLTGVTEGDIMADALRQLGSTPEHLTAPECFRLASRLASRCTADESNVLLHEAMDGFAGIAAEDSADGPFPTLPALPRTPAECVAALVWCAAGDAAKETRWNAAHTIRMWMALGCDDLITALNCFATHELQADAFVDARLEFYSRHALMWTLMATARAAVDPNRAACIGPMTPILRRVAFEDPPNTVLQHSARAALTRLHSAGTLTLTPTELEQCTASIAVVQVDSHRYSRALKMAMKVEGFEDPPAADDADDLPQRGFRARADTEFRFFFDFEDHWCKPLGEAFGIHGGRIAGLVDEVITRRWASPYRGEPEDDARHTYGLYRQDGTYAHKSDWPSEDDLDFYLSTHALYEVAGHLAELLPAYQEPEAERDDFTEWLQTHVPTRGDGRWTLDRRDPPPADIPSLIDTTPANQQQRDSWRFNIAGTRLDQILTPHDDVITLGGYWSASTYGQSETVHVKSALVDPRASRALINALRGIGNLAQAHIPNEYDARPRSAAGRFTIVDTVDSTSNPSGIDTEDPRAAGIGWPPSQPCTHLLTATRAAPDPDRREWRIDGALAFTTACWNSEYGRGEGGSGHRLLAFRYELAKALDTLGLDIVASVDLSRHDDGRYGNDREAEVFDEALQPYKKFFLIRSNGSDLDILN